MFNMFNMFDRCYMVWPDGCTYLRGMLIHRLKECGRMLGLFDMCQVFDRCLILVKKSERVYNSIESRTPPHASHAHPYNYTTSQTCCPCQTFDTMAAGLLNIVANVQHVWHFYHMSLSLSIYCFQFQTISNILSNVFSHLSFLSILFAFCCCYPFCLVLNSNHRNEATTVR